MEKEVISFKRPETFWFWLKAAQRAHFFTPNKLDFYDRSRTLIQHTKAKKR